MNSCLKCGHSCEGYSETQIRIRRCLPYFVVPGIFLGFFVLATWIAMVTHLTP